MQLSRRVVFALMLVAASSACGSKKDATGDVPVPPGSAAPPVKAPAGAAPVAPPPPVAVGSAVAAGSGSAAGAGSAAAGAATDVATGDNFIGPLKLGTTGKAALAALGKPGSQTKPREMAATGETVSDWSWPDRGVVLTMSGTKGQEAVSIIVVRAPSAFKTSKGIGVGSTRDEVVAADGQKAKGGKGDAPINLGDAYDPTVFTFKDGKVTEISRGGGAE